MVGLSDQKRLVRQIFEEGWKNNDTDVIDESCSGDIVLYGLPTSEHSADREQFKEFIHECHDAFPDLELAIDDVIAEEDRVVVRSSFAGTHDGAAFLNTEAAGSEVDVTNTITYRIENGRIAEAWVSFDTLGLLKQIGAVPENPYAYDWEHLSELH